MVSWDLGRRVRADGGLPAATWSRREKRGVGEQVRPRGPAGAVRPLQTAVPTPCIQTNSTWSFFCFRKVDRFVEHLRSQHNRGEGTESPPVPHPLPSRHSLPHVQHPRRRHASHWPVFTDAALRPGVHSLPHGSSRPGNCVGLDKRIRMCPPVRCREHWSPCPKSSGIRLSPAPQPLATIPLSPRLCLFQNVRARGPCSAEPFRLAAFT